jgi:hypothetical protein
MVEMRNAYKILVGKPEKETSTDGRMILKCILKRPHVKV